jgi:hypothetical protein
MGNRLNNDEQISREDQEESFTNRAAARDSDQKGP